MNDALALLGSLTDSDVTWILNAGEERQVIAETRVITEGATPDHVFVVLEGLVGVHLASLDDRQVATLGPGELLGEMSFVEGRPASATIKAIENTLLLVLSRDKLEAQLSRDQAFATRLYKSFAQIAARRLRERVGALGEVVKTSVLSAEVGGQVRERLAAPLEDFKTTVQKADQAALVALAAHTQPPPDLAARVGERFRHLCHVLNDEMETLGGQPHIREELGARMQREILPYLLLTRSGDRSYSKPRGYAGDYLTIEWLYQNQPAGSGRIGPMLDRCFMDLPVCRAVRNRRRLVADAIGRVLEAAAPHAAHVTSLACGPAAELFDVFEALDEPARLKVSLIDIDPEALSFVRATRDAVGLESHMDLYAANLVYLATGRTVLTLSPQDLVYSIGLIDYFNDHFVVNLMNYGYRLLKPGGRLILGNFHPRNPNRALLDHILDWKLIHRTENDLNRLYAASTFGRPCTKIQFEGENINLFAECVR